MEDTSRKVRELMVAVATFASFASVVQAQNRTELMINDTAVRIVRDSLPRATGVTIVGDSAFVLVGLLKAVVVPYRRPTPGP